MREKVPRAAFIRFIGLILILSACAGPENGEVPNPSSFNATPGLTTVQLSWSAVSEATGYTLERQEGAGAFQTILPNRNQTTYEDTSLKANTNYTYRLKAVKNSVSSSGVERNVKTVSQGSAVNVSILTPSWLSKQATSSGNPSEANNAPNNVTVSGSNIVFNNSGDTESGEAVYYLGGLCTKFTGRAEGSGTFKIVADDEQVWPNGGATTGGTGDVDIVGKQSLSLIFQGTGTGTWANPQVFCEGTPSAPNEKAIRGEWLPEFSWGGASPIVPTHAANLPDGRIATWASWKEFTYGYKGDGTDCPEGASLGYCEETEGFIWNYKDNSFQESDNETHDMFCAGLAVLPDGRVFGGGGGSFDSSGGGPADSQYYTSYFDFRTNAWTQGRDGDMGAPHWYGTAVAMPDSRIFMVGGASGDATAEILNNPDGGTWNFLSTTDVSDLYALQEEIFIPNSTATDSEVDFAERFEWSEVQQWYPFLNVAPNGTLFQSGPIPRLHNVTLNGSSGLSIAGTPGDPVPASHAQMRTFGNSIMFDEGKILVTGGSRVRGAGAAKTAMVMDINGAAVEVTTAPDMRFSRTHHNGVVLPTGEVLVVGGNTSGKQFTDEGYRPGEIRPDNANYRWNTDVVTESVFTSEVYNPAKNTWRDLDAMDVPRNYHSVGILLEDGTVLAAGGGLCGDVGTGDPPSPTGPSCNHPDGQIFQPPYLFKANGDLAPRPVIGNLSGNNVTSDGSSLNLPKVGYNKQFTVTMNNLGEGTRISRFTMIKLSSVTHSINTDVRFLEVSFTGSGTTYTLTTEESNSVLTPGYYFLFAINDKGVPSVAKVVQVN
jgi:hypothetical protein